MLNWTAEAEQESVNFLVIGQTRKRFVLTKLHVLKAVHEDLESSHNLERIAGD